MANNVSVKDSADAAKVFKTTDTASVHVPHHNVDTITAGASADIGAVADAAVGDASGSLNAHSRQAAKILTANLPAPGQAAMAASLPVVIASNQTGIPLAASAAMIGGVRDDGPFQTPYQKYTTSADMSGGVVSITDALVDTGKRIIVDDLCISCGTTMEVSLKEETSGTEFASVFVLANTAFTWSPKNKLRCQVSNKKLQAISSVSGQIRITATWHEEV